jgi:TPR repeat protein
MGQCHSGLVAVVAAALFVTPVLAGSLDDAKRASAQADFATELKLAKAGDPVAQEMIGELYDTGIGVKRDYGRALNWYRRASAQGNVASERRLGFKYYFGNGVARDPAVAAAHFRVAAERDDPIAEAWLGTAYEIGEAVPQDDEQSDFWKRKAAEHGDPLAAFALLQIWMYDPGPHPPKDYERADERSRKAAADGAAYAQYILGVRYRDGLHAPIDRAQAQVWMRKAAEQGYGPAQYELGRLVSDKAEEATWYVKAAASGQPLALGSLLSMCRRAEVTGAVCEQAETLNRASGPDPRG